VASTITPEPWPVGVVTVTILADAFFARSGVESRALADTTVARGEADGGAWAMSEVEPPRTRIAAGQSQMAKGRRRGIISVS
jgi:hypothetical protein